MRRICAVLTIAFAPAFAALACTGANSSTGSTSPSTTTMNTTPAVTAVSVSGTAPTVGATSPFTATTTLSNGTTQTVTTQAAWASSNAGVATVTSAGIVTGVSAGSADITATYQSVSGVSRLTIGRLTFTVSGTVRDGTSNGVLPNINVSTVDSAGVRKTTTTNGSGGYSMAGVAAGVVVMTFAATGYQTATQSILVAADSQVNVSLPRVGSSPSPTPTPTPAPTPTPTPTPTSVDIEPAGGTVRIGDIYQFTAVVSPAGASQAVVWNVSGSGCSGASCGTIDASGKYTAPPAPPNPPTVTVTARSAVDSTKSEDVTVTIILLLHFSMNPTDMFFGTQTVNTTSAPRTATLTNMSSTPQPVSVRMGGFAWTEYVQTNDCPPMIAVGASCIFTITFRPTTTGSRIGYLIVDGSVEEMGLINLYGTGGS